MTLDLMEHLDRPALRPERPHSFINLPIELLQAGMDDVKLGLTGVVELVEVGGEPDKVVQVGNESEDNYALAFGVACVGSCW